MDSMIINSKIGTAFLSNLLSYVLRKKLKNKNIIFDLENVKASLNEDGYVRLHVEGNVTIHEHDLLGLIKEAV